MKLKYNPEYPDRILVKVDSYPIGLTGKMGMIQVSESGKSAWIPANNIPWLLRWLKKEEFQIPSLFAAKTLADMEWLDAIRRHDVRAMYVFQNAVILQHKYARSLARLVNRVCSGSQWSAAVEGWVIPHATPDQINELVGELSPYGVAISPNVLNWGIIQDKEIYSERAREAEALFSVPVPLSGRVYKDHQRDAILNMAMNRWSYLADQVGLGKGGEFLGTINALEAFPCVLVCTKTMIDELFNEIDVWTPFPEVKVQHLTGQTPVPVDPDAHFIVLNYDILQHHEEEILLADPKGMICDESHALKNPDSKRSWASWRISEHIRNNHPEDGGIILASGTPFTNGPWELWSPLEILGYADEFGEIAKQSIGTDTYNQVIRTRKGKLIRKTVALDNRTAFEQHFCGGRYDRWGNWRMDATNEDQLHNLLVSKLMVRRKKSDVLHPLPPLLEDVVDLSPTVSEEDRERYEEIEAEFLEWLKAKAVATAEEEGISIERAIQIALKKAANGQAIMQMTALRQQCGLMKVPGTIDWIHRYMSGHESIFPDGREEIDKKLVVFAHHRAVQQAIYNDPQLQQYGVVTILAGSDQDGDSIQAAKLSFQTDPSVRLIVCSLGAAREGHTLTAAGHIFLAEMPFVPTWVVQVAGRSWARFSPHFDPHRCTIHYGVASGTTDDSITRKSLVKKASFDAVIDAENIEVIEETEEWDEVGIEMLAEWCVEKQTIGLAR